MERNFPVVIEQDEETGKFVVTCPILQGCYTQGDTLQDAMENIREAIVLCLEDIPSDEQRGWAFALSTPFCYNGKSRLFKSRGR